MDTAPPRVSVVLTTHNRSRWMSEALASVLNQTWRDFEVLVVDDASTDDTREVVRAVDDPRVRYLRNERNLRLPASRNRGIREARGEWVAFLDDDDAWLPEKLEKQIAVVGRGAADLGLVYTGSVMVDRVSGKIHYTWLPAKRGDLSEVLRDGNCLGPGGSTALARKTSLERAGLFDEDLRYGEDYDLWIRLASAASFDFVAEPLIRCGIHPSGMTRSWVNWAAAMEPLLRKHEGYFGRQMRSEYLVAIGISRCMSGEMGAGRRAFLRAISLSPLTKRPLVHFLLSLGGQRFYAYARLRREDRRFGTASASEART
ncbi:MAG: glycosyltransferase [Acidobacteria bacterium]|nr:glycosyltransferase [Acidobacteriota bacterium]